MFKYNKHKTIINLYFVTKAHMLIINFTVICIKFIFMNFVTQFCITHVVIDWAIIVLHKYIL